MLDIQFIRDNAELVQEKSKQKGYNVSIQDLLRLDAERRELTGKIEALRAERNQISDALKGGNPSTEQIDRGREVKGQVSEAEALLEPINDSYQKLIWAIPNTHLDDVPVGNEADSVEIKKYGDQPTGAEDHLSFALKHDWVDFERGSKVAGAKFYYLKGDLALLENAITQFALDLVIKKGFTYMTVPHLVNSRTATGTGFAPRTTDQEDQYFIEGEDLSLIGTAEIPLTGYHADEIIDEDNIPLLYAGFSPSYRKEAGTYGKHSHGLFRVHQFNKLEMYAFTLPEASQAMHEQLLSIEEEIWQAINIPYHIINIASGDLGAPAAKKYDIEYWSKVDGKYRELTSCSNCTDFQTRNLNIRVRRKNGQIEILHSLNGTAVSLARSLVAIIEHYQTADGKLSVPAVLRQYMGGKTVI
jgi:seryl-tRNA synthetase